MSLLTGYWRYLPGRSDQKVDKQGMYNGRYTFRHNVQQAGRVGFVIRLPESPFPNCFSLSQVT